MWIALVYLQSQSLSYEQTVLSLWPSLSMYNEYCIVWTTLKDYFIAIVICPDQGMAKQELQYLILVVLQHLLKGLGKLFILCHNNMYILYFVH